MSETWEVFGAVDQRCLDLLKFCVKQAARELCRVAEYET